METKPQFHITGETGWINDPNGLVRFNGKYHVFFQYNPFDVHWGPMHWGHVVSDDLTHWERAPIALAPGDNGDRDGCFSGSALAVDGTLWVLYTGFEKRQGGDTARQVQCLASSADGITFRKHGVVIGSDAIPSEYDPCDFRDPKVFALDDGYGCVVAAKKRNGRGRVLLYRSRNLYEWRFIGDLFGTDCDGGMLECPDFRKKENLLLTCEQFAPSEGRAHKNIHTTRWHLGTLDLGSGKFSPSTRGIVDYGFDFYAPQTFPDEPILIAWLNMWDRNVPSEQYGFAGMLTVPRRFWIENGELKQEPICKAHEILRCNVYEHLTDRAETGILTICANHLKSLRLAVRVGAEAETVLLLRQDEWIFDRSHSGCRIDGAETDADSLAGIRRMPYNAGDRTELTVCLDRYSVEIFADGRALSSTIYPPDGADGILLNVEAVECVYTRSEIE